MRSLKWNGWVLGLAATSLLSGAISGQATTILPVRDNTLYDFPAGLTSNGSGPHLYVGRSGNAGGNSRRRALLRFDLAAALPTTPQRVLAVQLILNVSSSNANPTTIRLHRLFTEFGEGSSNAGTPGGTGALAIPPDATWTHARFPSSPWLSPGGDFDPMPKASFSVSSAGVYVVPSSPDLVADVQDMLDHPESNHGWILISDEVPGIAKRIDSREFAGREPTLEVTHAPDIPALASATGPACPILGPCALSLLPIGLPSLGNSGFALSIQNGLPSAIAYLGVSEGPAASPLLLPGGCELLLDAASLILLGPFALDPTGSLVLSVPVPLAPEFSGVQRLGQVGVMDQTNPAGLCLSNALLVRFGL